MTPELAQSQMRLPSQANIFQRLFYVHISYIFEIGIDEYILNLLKLWEMNGWLLRYGLNNFQPWKMHILINFTCMQTFVQTAINDQMHTLKGPVQAQNESEKVYLMCKHC